MEERNETLSWRSVAYAACALLLALGGVVVGLWSQSLDKRLDDIAENQSKQWEVLNQRASLAPRLDAIERQTSDQEQRLRTVERATYGRR